MKKALLVTVLLAAAALIWFLPRCGRMLVVDGPEKADAIVVLAGDSNDVRYWRGMQLLRQGYGRDLLLDAAEDFTHYGQTSADAAEQFVSRSAGALGPRVHVCRVRGDSTVEESKHVAACLEKLHARSALLVTSDYHTRRAFSIFRRRLPQYRWSVAAAGNSYLYGGNWWKNREWAKTTLTEWQKLIWWQVVER
jgi:uncharacterized SAM-binding protein YcdF (DUF218 family)